MRGAVVFVNLPPPRRPPTHVQAGRRPAVIVHTEGSKGALPVTLLVPGTSNLNAVSFPHTVRVDPSAENGLALPTIFLCFQVQPADKRIIELPARGRLSTQDLERVDQALREVLAL